MGVDRDFATAVDLAIGEYCWLFSDDDLLKPGAIQAVFEAIKGGYALVIANGEVRNADMSRPLETKRLPLTADRVYKPTENQLFLADNLDYLTFIGCVIIRSGRYGTRGTRRNILVRISFMWG